MDTKDAIAKEEYREEIDLQKPLYSSERAEYDNLLITFDAPRQKKLLRKIDMRLLPPLALLYLVSYMDRTNMGNAKLQNLTEDLKLSPQQYTWYCSSLLSAVDTTRLIVPGA